ALAGGVLLIGTVLAGNSLVCMSVASKRALQTPTNYFILSLAAADLLLALLVLPLFVYSEVHGGEWLLSPRLCDVLMAMDVMLCTASIFNLCAISVDRFAAVTVPLNYGRQGRPQLLLIGATWLLSAAPVQRPRSSPSTRDPGGPLRRRSHGPATGLPCLLDCAPAPGLPRDPCGADCVAADDLPDAALPQQARRRPRAKITSRERKAMRVLPVVVGAFLVCWTPFFVVHITQALCPACSVSPRLVSAVTWLGYVNSALNPVIYTIFNAEFRTVFRKALRLGC
ncbi:D(4) dopamine receptor, partial [Fukomys damarensis]|uniref:D(4) dopamine receptor n=1 Tax=Fukomys damarensis TaxID=885580 RepID=UPI00053FB2E9